MQKKKEISMQILYGTTNQGKLESMRKITDTLGVELIGLKELDQPIPVVEESGKNPLENAEIKARAYYKAFGMPVFSCDSGLYFDELEEEEQPGIYVRRVHGKELSDEEMIEYYSELARAHGGRMTGRYRNAICFILDEDTYITSMDEKLATEPFIMVTKPHPKRVPGFPIDSLSVDIRSGKYYYDLTEKTVESVMEQGFAEFFQEALCNKG